MPYKGDSELPLGYLLLHSECHAYAKKNANYYGPLKMSPTQPLASLVTMTNKSKSWLN